MKGLLILLCTFLAGGLWAQEAPSWLRYPSISPDGQTIVFTYQGNLYKVPANGGTATPLTTDSAHECMPVWSHDGRYIAFAGSRYGNFDIFMIPATGGPETRLTFHSADEFPYDFTERDSTVFFGAVRLDDAGNRQFPSDGMPELYQVPAGGGRVTQVLTTPAEDARISRSGQYIIYHDKKGRENAWRKHQLSSIARDIWIYDRQTNTHKKITTFKGEDRNPVFTPNEQGIYYLSETSGSFNVYQLSLNNPAQTQQVTNFQKHPVRFLTIAGNGTLCFSYNGELYTKQPNKTAQKLRVRIPAVPQQTNRQQVAITDNINNLIVSPNGKEAAFICRGEVFACNIATGAIKRITDTPGEEADLSFSPDGQYLLYATESKQGWQIAQTAIASGRTAVLIQNEEDNYQPLHSPDGKEIAYIANRTALKIYNTATRQTRTILGVEQLSSRSDHDQFFRWSPDGKWILFQYNPGSAGNLDIGIIRADGKGQLQNLTESGYGDEHPQWAMNGSMMIWNSDRNGLRSYSNSGRRQHDIYALFFTQNAWEHFKWEKDTSLPYSLQNQPPARTTDAGLQIDWDGLKDRTVKLTLSPSMLADALLTPNGDTLYTLATAGREYSLWITNLRNNTSAVPFTVKADDASLQWDSAQHRLFLLADNNIIQLGADGKELHHTTIKDSMSINPAAERRAMFLHVWNRTRSAFYTKGYHGADWDGYKRDYEKYLPHISNNYELAEMLSELLGELNVSHSGATYNNKMSGKDVTASLGALYDLQYKGPGMRLTEIIKNGPLDNSSLHLQPGMLIEAIDGQPITPDKDLAQYLNHKAGKPAVLTINGHNITIKPISPDEEADLLYKRWVKRNQQEVEEKSKGQLGYVHLYRMNDDAYRNAYGEMMGRYTNRKGIIVDTRFNRGGDLASDLEMFLSGQEILQNTTDSRLVGIEPGFRWTKPSIVLANEANYSDGHCFVFGYQYLHMGKLVGMPVPGSCTFMTGESLQDNSMHWSVPSLGVKSMEGYYLENHQTEPDIPVMNEFEKVSTGTDQQLQEAIKQLMLAL
ncbi:peptidase S41 [Chitinophaga agrisoli]|uniref:Tricorn protease homolog n=1 Tax=Chitinophaga agrisoli TaxID=2607653 RepID=A0A5B2VM94_9BACT|nr:S41 family peptidase [Chitinophaga agrisoli]KAA2240733.1 peptidase S41 [Chitinophaga agrisoli]